MKVFIASSTEALQTARELASWLSDEGLEPKVWDDTGAFRPGEYNYNSLLRISTEVQAAIILMTADDQVWYRGKTRTQPRDNVLIEFGLFSARLSLSNAIIIGSGSKVTADISDLAGINCIDYSNRNKAHLAVTEWSKRLLSAQKGLQPDLTPCKADWQISTRLAQTIDIDTRARDASNLFFVLLSVVDCHKSRIIIEALQAESFHDISIETVYDLLGTWDLLIKFSVASHTIADKFYQEIVKTLISKKMMDDSEVKSFGKRTLINVLAQSKTIVGLITPKEEEIINYVLLPKNSDYDNFRASRSFVFIQAVGDRGSTPRKTFLKALNGAIESGIGKSIIESICEGENELIIETLSTCSQSNFINRLNREIEPVLTTYELQKYTLSCYYHDESGLLSNAKAAKDI